MSLVDPKSASAADAHDDGAHDGAHHGPPRLAEPETPMWLPVVGVVLFALGGLAWLLTPPFNPVATGAIDAAGEQAAPSAASAAPGGSAEPNADVKRFLQGHVPPGH